MVEHTKGPLATRPAGGGDVYVTAQHGLGIGCAYSYGESTAGMTRFPAEANATLWAAAPELLYELETLVRIAKEKWGSHNEFPAAEAAIRKARGEVQP